MPSQNEQEVALRQQAYRLLLEVDRLQRVIYEENGENSSEEQMDEWVQTQIELYKVEEKLREVGTTQTEPEPAVPEMESQPDRPVTRGGGRSMGVPPPGYSARRGLDTTELDVDVRLQMAQVPTAIYHLLDPQENPLVECRVRTNSSRKRRLRIISFIEGYSAQAVDTLEISNGTSNPISQLPTLFPDRLNQVRELTRATLNVLAEDLENKQIEVHKTIPIWLLSRNSAPLSVKNPTTQEWNDLSRYYGAFVTPNQVDVRRFLRDVVEHHAKQQLSGYHEPVTPQVRAIYEALQQKVGIRYVSSVLNFNPDEGAKTQRVQLPRQSLEEKVANCIDGVLLFASLLESISINPAIVILPKHALLGWETGLGNNHWAYLETTMLGGAHTFESACDRGTRLATANEEQQKRANHNDRAHELWFRRWSLYELRTRHGITPME
jgi:hypothetical protein